MAARDRAIHARASPGGGRWAPYVAPTAQLTVLNLSQLVAGVRPLARDARQTATSLQPRLHFDDDRGGTRAAGKGSLDKNLWCAGETGLVRRPCIAIVGARDVSSEGAGRARQLARDLAAAGVVVVSGLARGVDTEALTAAIEARGRVIAVIGTPIDKAYPTENRRLQERIYREHLLISPFPPGQRVFRGNFPERNRLMAAVSDASVIVEADDVSGALHQAAECVRLGRWMFIARAVMEDPALRWPGRFAKEPTVKVLTETADILGVLPRG
jgi:DNA processing protein